MGVEEETSPIIIYGAPRSGTTYLNNIVNKHPEVFISRETRLFVWAHESLNVLTQRKQSLLNHRQEFVEHLYGAYPKLIRDFYRTLRPRARYWGDKNPHYASKGHQGCLETINTLFPGTRFIHILRDGRDVVSSLVRKRDKSGEPWTDFEGAHRIWTSHIDLGCEFGRSQLPSQYFELRYEDLIRDDVGIARKLFDFLGIEIHPNVVEFCQDQQEERTPLSRPTRDLNVGATMSDWRKSLTPVQQLRSLELLGEHLVRYGYETEASLVKIRQELDAQLEQERTEHTFPNWPKWRSGGFGMRRRERS